MPEHCAKLMLDTVKSRKQTHITHTRTRIHTHIPFCWRLEGVGWECFSRNAPCAMSPSLNESNGRSNGPNHCNIPEDDKLTMDCVVCVPRSHTNQKLNRKY